MPAGNPPRQQDRPRHSLMTAIAVVGVLYLLWRAVPISVR